MPSCPLDTYPNVPQLLSLNGSQMRDTSRGNDQSRRIAVKHPGKRVLVNTPYLLCWAWEIALTTQCSLWKTSSVAKNWLSSDSPSPVNLVPSSRWGFKTLQSSSAIPKNPASIALLALYSSTIWHGQLALGYTIPRGVDPFTWLATPW